MGKEPETPVVEPEEVNDDVDLEDMEVSFDDAESEEETLEETSEEASKEEPKEEETDDAETEAEEDESEESKEEDDKSEASEETDESKEDDDSQMSDEDKLKQHNKEQAEKRIQEKKEKAEKEAEQKKQLDEYVAEAPDDTALAVRQLQVEAYKTKVETNLNKLQTGHDRAMKDFPILSEPAMQRELDDALRTFTALHVDVDEWDNPREVRGDLYSFLQTKAESIQRLTQVGAKKESNAKSKGKANTLTPPSRTPKEPKKDEMLEGFDEEWSR